MDTSISYTDRDYAYFSSDEAKWIRRIRQLKAEHPDQVTIDHEPETNDGCICARIPVNYIKIQPKRERILTDEQKAMVAERFKNARKNALNKMESE